VPPADERGFVDEDSGGSKRRDVPALARVNPEMPDRMGNPASALMTPVNMSTVGNGDKDSHFSCL